MPVIVTQHEVLRFQVPVDQATASQSPQSLDGRTPLLGLLWQPCSNASRNVLSNQEVLAFAKNLQA